MTGGADVLVGSGVESISLVHMGGVNLKHFTEEHLLQVKHALWMTMIETAEIVAQRYGISRTRQDEYALQSQLRTAAAQGAGKFADEIVPLTTKMKKIDKASGAENQIGVTVTHDECNSPDTTLEGLAALSPVHAGGQQIAEGKFITTGNASQFVDGASAFMVMSEETAAKKRHQAVGHLQGLCRGRGEPDEMGIGPVLAVPKISSAPWDEGWRHRSLGAERGLRQPDPLLHGQARARPQKNQRQWRRHFHGPSLWHDGRPPDRPCPAGGAAARRKIWRCHHVHRRWHGRGRPVRDTVSLR